MSTKGYSKKIDELKQCFLDVDDCISKGFKVFNNECYKDCPTNTNEKDSDGICYCSYFYYKNLQTNLYNCFSENETCEDKEYNYKIDDEKQCFDSLDDYINKGYKTFNNKCYATCPENTYEKN